MSEKYESRLQVQRAKVLDFIIKCAEESRLNEKDPRRSKNIKNWQYFHGNIDWSHKRPGDAKIHLHKIGVAAERTRSKFKKNLMNYAKWIDIEREYAKNEDLVLSEHVAKNLLVKQLEYADAKTAIADSLLIGTLEGRATIDVSGKYVTKPRFVKNDGKLVKEEKQYWQLSLKPLNYEQYLCDTFDRDCALYQIEEFRTDFYKVLKLSSQEQTYDKPYRLDAVKELTHFAEREQEEAQKQAENNAVKQDQNKSRKQILIQNFYGTILDENGEVLMWETSSGEKLPLENIFCVVGNEKELILDPQRIVRSSGKAPYISTELLRSPGTGTKALMDAGTDLNEAMNELFSLMLDGAIKSVHNAHWYREDYIAKKSDISGGILAGASIAISSDTPPNTDPIGTIETGKVPQEAFMMLNTADRSYAENVLSNQIDLSGNLPGKQIRATELVQADSAIGDIFDSLAGDVEDKFIEPLAEECFYEIIDHIDEMDPDEVRACFGEEQDKAEAFLNMSPKERFSQVNGLFKFCGRGLHGIMSSMAKAQYAINLLNTLTANPITAQYVEGEISIAKLAQIVIKGFGFDLEEVTPSQSEKEMIRARQLIQEQALAQSQVEPGAGGAANAQQGSQPSPEQPGPEALLR